MYSIPIGETMSISEKDKNIIFKFATDSEKKHSSRGRTYQNKIEHIIRGKTGELGWELMCRKYNIPVTETCFEIYENEGDKGKDHIVNGVITDVKSIVDPNYNLGFKDFNNTTELYVLCLVDETTVKFLGMITKKEIIEKKLYEYRTESKSKKTFLLVDKKHLRPMNEIF